MLRAFLLLSVATSATPAWADCPVPGQVVLTVEEFTLAGYDAERGVVGVRPAALLAAGPRRAQAMRLAVPDQPFLLKVDADQVQGLTEAHAGGALELVVAVRPAPGPRPPDDCATYVPDEPQLRVRGDAVAPAAAPESEAAPVPAPPPPPAAGAVRLAHPNTEPEDAEFPVARTQRFAREAAEHCLASAEGPVPHGALMVELGVSPAGAPRPVKVVLDQLMHEGVRDCLTRQLDGTPGLWADWPPGGLMYQPIYFRPGATSAGMGPEANGANAP
ncbi:MAG: hypothetical protein H6702_12305 [Myxococcales bacterium]|nr:hypothetical protein [Myxococcales bacterium]